jgi:hypothetical protein
MCRLVAMGVGVGVSGGVGGSLRIIETEEDCSPNGPSLVGKLDKLEVLEVK